MVFAFAVISRISKYIIADANQANPISRLRVENHYKLVKFVE